MPLYRWCDSSARLRYWGFCHLCGRFDEDISYGTDRVFEYAGGRASRTRIQTIGQKGRLPCLVHCNLSVQSYAMIIPKSLGFRGSSPNSGVRKRRDGRWRMWKGGTVKGREGREITSHHFAGFLGTKVYPDPVGVAKIKVACDTVLIWQVIHWIWNCSTSLPTSKSMLKSSFVKLSLLCIRWREVYTNLLLILLNWRFLVIRSHMIGLIA